MEGGGRAAADVGGGAAYGSSASHRRAEVGQEAEAGTDGGRGPRGREAEVGSDGGRGRPSASTRIDSHGRPIAAIEGIDYVWSHGDQIGVGFKCKYCLTTFQGGGATRLRHHLAGIIGNVKSCQQVPQRGEFDSRGARLASSQMSPSAWWYMYGGHAKVLQKYAMKIVSQCVSSSGCERNWSTFALVHTKVRNRLGYDKLHKLVYVHYNLKLRLQMQEADRPDKELDPCAVLMDTALHDQDNPIMDWLARSIRESEPVMDEPGDPPTPSRVVLEEVRVVLEDPPVPSRVVLEDPSMPSSSRVVPGKSGETLLDKPLNVWVSKRKRLDIIRKKKAKKGRKDSDEDDVESGEDTSTPSRSLSYVDTDDSTSVSDDDGDDDVHGHIGGEIAKAQTKKTKDLSSLY